MSHLFQSRWVTGCALGGIKHRAMLALAMCASVSAGCANFHTIHIVDHEDEQKKRATLVFGDAKQAETAIGPNPESFGGNANLAPPLAICPGKNPDVYSVTGSSGALGFGTQGAGAFTVQLSGSASEAGAIIAPLAAVQMNRDNQTTVCFDRLNGWIPETDYDAVQMRIRNETLAAFAFQAISLLGSNSTTSQPISATGGSAAANQGGQQGGDQQQGGGGQSSSGGGKDNTVQQTVQDPKAGKGGSTKKSKSNQSTPKQGKATQPSGDNSRQPDAQTQRDDASQSQSGAAETQPGQHSPGGPTSVTPDQTNAIVAIYLAAIDRSNEITPFCLRVLEGTSPLYYPDNATKIGPTILDTIKTGCVAVVLANASGQINAKETGGKSVAPTATAKALLDDAIKHARGTLFGRELDLGPGIPPAAGTPPPKSPQDGKVAPDVNNLQPR